MSATPDSGSPASPEPIQYLVTYPNGEQQYWPIDPRKVGLNPECDDIPSRVEPLYAHPPAALPVAQRPTDDELWDQTLKERDEYHDMADQLAAQIAAITGEEIGEHSSANDPWRNAMLAADDYIAQAIRRLINPARPALPEPVTISASSMSSEQALNLATTLIEFMEIGTPAQRERYAEALAVLRNRFAPRPALPDGWLAEAERLVAVVVEEHVKYAATVMQNEPGQISSVFGHADALDAANDALLAHLKRAVPA